ncbi:hypothetical protein BH09VER1_BH09VER1_46650 [soil metagenome]
MNTLFRRFVVPLAPTTPARFAAFLVAALPWISTQAQTTGFNKSTAGPFDYNDTANWVGGNINGIWDSSLTLTASQTITFASNTTLSSGLSFGYLGNYSETLRSTSGGPLTLTLDGDIAFRRTSGLTLNIGSATASQALNVDLDGGVRTLTVWGGGNGATFGASLNFFNTVSNGGLIVTGEGSGGGRVLFSSPTSLTSLTVGASEVAFTGTSATNTVETVSGTVTANFGAAAITLNPNAAKNTQVQAAAFSRNSGATILFRGTNLGVNSGTSATANSSNVMFTTGPTLVGGGGGSGTSTISILAGAFGDTSASGTGFGATGGLVTYDAANGIRLLASNEYTTAISDGQTQLDNVRYSNSSGTQITTNLTSGSTTINSLSFVVSGSTGNQGINITGDPGTILKINSGVIYADQNVTTAGSPATTDAMTLSVPILDFNGQEAIILANTRLNTGGTVVSNGALNINSAITNATGITFGDGMLSNPSGYITLGGTAANTYTGTATINGAIVRLGKTGTNSTSTITGDLLLNLGSVYDAGNQVADTANLFIRGGTFFLNGSNNSGSATSETVNNLTMSGGSVSPGSGSGNTFTLLGNLDLSGGTITMARAAKLNVSGSSSFSGGIVSVSYSTDNAYNSKTRLVGDVTISNIGSGTYTPITVASATSAITTGGQVELSGDLTFVGNGTNANTVTIDAPNGVGAQGVIALNGTRTFNIGHGAASVDLTVNAPLISGTTTGGLIKSGSGVLALNGANTYTGSTAVSAGTLLLNGSGVSAVTINGGALSGSGTVSNTVAVANSGTITAGNNAIGTLSTGDLSLTGTGATLAFELSGTGSYDQLNVIGAVNLSGNGKIALSLVAYTPALNDLFFPILNDSTDAINGTLFGLAQGATFSAGGYLWQVSYTGDSAGNTFTGGNDLALQVVPEPQTWALIAAAGIFLLVMRRRRSSRVA